MKSELRWRFGPWIVLIIAAAAYYPRFIKFSDGMAIYPRAASCMLHNEVMVTCEKVFSYPPVFAFLMIPFTWMPIWLRDCVWYAITIVAIVASFKLCEKLARSIIRRPLDATELMWLRLLGMLMSAKFVLAVLENQAYDAFVLMLILLGLVALVTRRDSWGGASLAFAAALKATPVIFLPYLLVKRRFVAALVFAVVLAALSYLPDLFFHPTGSPYGYFNTWLHEVAGAALGVERRADFVFWAGANLMNHSLRGLVSLNIDEETHRAAHHMVLYAVYAAFIAIVGTLILLSPRRRDSIAIDGSLLLISMLMLSPMTSRSHYIDLMLPYMVVVAFGLRDERTLTLGRIVLWLSFFLATATSNDIVGQTITDWAYGHSFLVLGALVLLVYFAVMVWRRFRDEQAATLAPAVLPSG
jgi:alpha-1,2-mannosyltransferase